MPRPPRIIDSEGVYHVIGRGNNKARIFHDVEDFKKYLNLLHIAKATFHFSLYHYVLMPNHVHLLLKPNSYKMSAFMHAVHMPFAKYYCKKYKFVGHVWQGRYKNLIIENDAYLLACGNYIEMNPVRAGLVSKPEEWPYSSYRYYSESKKDPLVEADPFFPELGRTPEERRLNYVKLVARTRSF